MKRKALSRRKRKSKPRKAPPPDSLGENLKAARAAKGYTQIVLAHAAGYTGDDAGAVISRFENGAQAPRIDTLSRIAEALGVPVCSLLPK